MKVLAKYGYTLEDEAYVCELDWEEMNLIHKGKVKDGDIVEVPDIYRQARELREAESKIAGVLRTAKRSASILQSLNEEIDAARLDVNDKKAPELAVIRAHIAYLEALTKDVMPNA